MCVGTMFNSLKTGAAGAAAQAGVQSAVVNPLMRKTNKSTSTLLTGAGSAPAAGAMNASTGAAGGTLLGG